MKKRDRRTHKLFAASADAPAARLENERDPAVRQFLEAKAKRGISGRPADVQRCELQRSGNGCYRNACHVGRTAIMTRDPKTGSILSGIGIGAFKSRGQSTWEVSWTWLHR